MDTSNDRLLFGSNGDVNLYRSAANTLKTDDELVANVISPQGTSAKIYSGTGDPEGVITARRGSIYMRTDGGAGSTMYLKETGDATNTGWDAK